MTTADDELDLVLAALLTGLALNEQVSARIAAAGHPDLRFSHGFVFQHVVPGPLAIGELAAALRGELLAALDAAGGLEAVRARRVPLVR